MRSKLKFNYILFWAVVKTSRQINKFREACHLEMVQSALWMGNETSGAKKP